MYVQLTAIIVDTDAENLREMSEFLGEHGAMVVAQLTSVEQLQDHLARNEGPQVVLVNLDPDPQDTLRRTGGLIRAYAGVSFFVMSQAVDARLVIDAMHLGVREFVPLPLEEEKFRQALERVAQLSGAADARARVINIIPMAGGCGSTTVACNVATALSRKGKTALIDLDLVRGTVANSFDLRPRFTIADLMRQVEKIDRQVVENALTVHGPTGLSILARPEMPEEGQRVTAEGLGRLLNVFGRSYDYVVIDSAMSVEPAHMAAARMADLNVLVVEQNVPSVKNAERFMGVLRRTKVDDDRIRVVVNRHVKRGADVELADMERALKTKVGWTVPNDFKNAISAINMGEPVVLRAPRADISSSLCGLAGALNGRTSHP